MLNILAIDTTGEQGSAAIVGTKNSSYICIGEIFFNARTGKKAWTHSEALMPGVEQLFELTRLEPTDINYVAYTSGPGSFTGLRIGASCALAISRALGVPAIAVPTLDAMAQNITGGKFIVPMLDARRGQIYTAVYLRENSAISRQTEYMAISVEEFLQNPTGREMLPIGFEQIFFLGDGACANSKIIREKVPNAIFANAANNRQRAASVGVCAFEKIRAGDEFKVELIYVRAPQAVRESADAANFQGCRT